MSNIKLLGLIHGESPHDSQSIPVTLSGAKSDEFLVKNYFPSFAQEHTLLIVEGNFHKDILNLSHSQYEKFLPSISNALTESDLGPDILYADTRWRDIKKGFDFYLNFVKLNEWMYRNLKILESINTTELDLEFITKGIIEKTAVEMIGFPQEPDYFVRKFCLEAVKQHTQMEEYMLSKAHTFSNDYDQIFILTGFAHTLEILRSEKIEFDYLQEINNQQEAIQLLVSTLFVKEIPRIITERYCVK